MHVYLNERRTPVKIITDGSQLFVIPEPPEDPDLVKETEKTLKRYQKGELKDMGVNEFLRRFR